MPEETINSESCPVRQNGNTGEQGRSAKPLRLFRLDPDETTGAAVVETDANGAPTGRNFVSVRWTTRYRTGTGGCPQWVDMIVVGDTLTAARKGKELIPSDNPVASSSFSSRDVLFIHVDGSGQRDSAFLVPNLVVAEEEEGLSALGNPIAKTFWFSNEPFAPGVLNPVEQKCHN